MNRVAILPTPADPHICMMWIQNYIKWHHYISQLYVYVNSQIRDDVRELVVKLFEEAPNTTVFQEDRMMSHGEMLAEVVALTDREYIMFVEDDGYVLKPEYVNEQFEAIESGQYDMVGSPRGSTSLDLIRHLAKRYNINVEGEGDRGIGFWPNFFFAKRSDLMKTDLHFSPKGWKKGEKLFDYEFKEDVGSDTFVWGSIQLYEMGLRAKEVPQFHCHTHWRHDYNEKKYIFDSNCPWIHAGSLSSCINGLLMHENGWPLTEYHRFEPRDPYRQSPRPLSDDERAEYGRRVAFCMLARETYPLPQLGDFDQIYLDAINRVIHDYRLEFAEVDKQKNVYKTLLNI